MFSGQRRGRFTKRGFSIALVITAVLTVTAIPLAMLEARGADRMFTFAAAGDIGGTKNSISTLTRLGHSNASLFLAVGALSYGGTGFEVAWCTLVISTAGWRVSLCIIAGFHVGSGAGR